MKLTTHEQNEMRRLSEDALNKKHYGIASDYSRYSCMDEMPLQMFDSVMLVYRCWLIDGFKNFKVLTLNK